MTTPETTRRVSYQTAAGRTVNIILSSERLVSLDGHECSIPANDLTVEVVGISHPSTSHRMRPGQPHLLDIGAHLVGGEYRTILVPLTAEALDLYRAWLAGEIAPIIADHQGYIAKAEEMLAAGKLLDQAKTERLRRSYANAVNEGGEGYNPYDDAPTVEGLAYHRQELARLLADIH